MKPPFPLSVLYEVATNNGASVTQIDHFSQQLFEVEYKDLRVRFGMGVVCTFPNNNATDLAIARDKTYALDLLHHHGFRVPDGKVFFLTEQYKKQRPAGREKEDAIRYASQLDYPVFVKPNAGCRGSFVKRIQQESELLTHIENHALDSPIMRIESPMKGNEYRILICNGEPLFAYQREFPAITGDGQRNTQTLVNDFIELQAQSGSQLAGNPQDLIEQLYQRYNLHAEDTPSLGETYAVGDAANLAAGGGVKHYTESFTEDVTHWCKKLYSVMGLSVMGVDVFCESNDLHAEALTVLEVNGNPSLESARTHSQSNVVHRLFETVFDDVFTP